MKTESDLAMQTLTAKKTVENDLRESRRAFFTLMSNLPGMVYRCCNNMNWTMEFVSQGCIDLTGYPPEVLIADRKIAFGELILRRDRERGWQKIQEALNKHEPFQRAYRIKTVTGEQRWVWEKGRGVYSDTGDLLALEGFITDISGYKRTEADLQRYRDHLEELVQERTAELSIVNHRLLQEVLEHKRTTESLEKSHQTLNNILRASPIGISLIERETFSWVNTQMCRIFGYKDHIEFRGKKFRSIFSSISEFQSLEALSNSDLNNKGMLFEMDAPLKRNNGEMFEGHIRMSCSNPTSPMEHAIVTVSDNTWRKKMEQKKIEMERLQGVLEMAGAVCHELNQPLQGLFLVVDTMALKDSLSTEDIEAIKPHIKRMAEITAKLMRVTRYETLEYINGKKIIDINRASSREEH